MLVRQTDVAGNVSTTGALTFTLDASVPAAPVITSPANGSTIATATPTITGTGEAGAVVTILIDGVVAGTATVGGGSTWTFTPAALSNAAHTITATETDPAGNVSTTSASDTFTVNSAVPVVTVALVQDTGSSAADRITSNAALTGTSDPGAAITLTENGTTIGTATANGSGVWSFTPSGLPAGAHTIVASETNGAGTTGSGSLTFTLDASAPAAPVITSPANGSTIATATPTITGTGEAGAVVTILIDGVTAGTATVGGGSTWTFTPAALSNAAHTITATETDTAGNVSAVSAADTFTINASGASPTDITLAGTNVNEFSVNDTVVGSLTTTDPDVADTFTYLLLDDAGGRFALDGANVVVANYILLDYEQHASHTITVRSTDAGGLVIEKTLTIGVNDVNPETVIGTEDPDHIVGGALADHINGADGNDHLVGGDGNDTLLGGIGDDEIESGAGDDNVSGEAGNDTVTVSGGADTVSMGTGDDDLLIVDYSGFSGGVGTGGNFGGTGLDWSGAYQVGQNVVQFTGVARFDIRGSSGADTIRTGSNNDRASLGGGNDTVDTGVGEVQLDGGADTDGWAADFIALTTAVAVNLQASTVTGVGASTIAGIETLGYSLSAYFKTGSGNDVLTTLAGPTNTFADYIQTNGGDDTVTVGGGNDTVEMGAGDHDLLIVDYSGYSGGVQTGGNFGGSGLDWSGTYQVNFSGPDYVQFTGVAHFDIRGGAGADNVITGGNSDIVSLGFGNDTADTGAGEVQLDGGGDTDAWAADFTALTTAVAVNLPANTVTGAGASTIASIERLGYSFTAYFKTGSGNDVLITLAGPANTFADYVQTNGGDDTVTVGGGNDTIEMGAGGDDLLIVDYSGYSGGVQTGGNFGGSGLDWSGTYQVNFSGPDYVQFTGVARFDIRGAAGADNIITGGNDDLIEGGAGNDTLTGGAGDDRFTFALGDGADTIMDFVAGAGTDDVIDLSGFANIHTLNDVLAVATQSGANTFIDFGGGDTITLQNVLKANLAAADFLFDQPPAAPLPTLATDSGASAGDRITNSGVVNVTGLKSGATWAYSTDNGTTYTTGTGISFTLTGDGTKSVLVRQTDVAGHTSADGTLTFTLDTARLPRRRSRLRPTAELRAATGSPIQAWSM